MGDWRIHKNINGLCRCWILRDFARAFGTLVWELGHKCLLHNRMWESPSGKIIRKTRKNGYFPRRLAGEVLGLVPAVPYNAGETFTAPTDAAPSHPEADVITPNRPVLLCLLLLLVLPAAACDSDPGNRKPIITLSAAPHGAGTIRFSWNGIAAASDYTLY